MHALDYAKPEDRRRARRLHCVFWRSLVDDDDEVRRRLEAFDEGGLLSPDIRQAWHQIGRDVNKTLEADGRMWRQEMRDNAESHKRTVRFWRRRYGMAMFALGLNFLALVLFL